MSTHIIGTRFSTKQFSYLEATQEFCAEASDLGDNHLSRLYDDACDVGFVLVSHKTGREVPMCLDRTDVDRRECETVGWLFRAVDPSLPFTAYVIND